MINGGKNAADFGICFFALLNSIKSKFKDSPEVAAVEVFRLLTTQGAVVVSGIKVSYNDKKIKELLNQS